MKSDPNLPSPEEVELKLALPGADPAALKDQLAQLPALAPLQPTQLHLHNIYYDTPEQLLHSKRTALRLRRVGSEAAPEWRQTLKTSSRSDSALSQRGEWETTVPDAQLTWDALEATPWPDFDPDGLVFQSLTPCFVTIFERTNWAVHQSDGSLVEVSLDIGHIEAGGKSAPIAELELELLAGQPAALFDLAQQIAQTVAVIPEIKSKAERGYALAKDALNLPLRAQPPLLTSSMALPVAAQHVFREMFSQFTSNLSALRASDDPELLHQARVGWRRFKSASRLFRPALDQEAVPSTQSLQTLLTRMGELRDIDVALTETLPPLGDAYMAGNAQRENNWQTMTLALTQAAQVQRQALRDALQTPAVGTTLLAITRWLETLPESQAQSDSRTTEQATSLRRWARHRMARLYAKLKAALKAAGHDPENQHRARILAKRLRYGISTLQPFLTKRHTQHWYQKALGLQTSIGMTRDLHQAGVLATKLEVDPGLVEFLRGVAAGQARMAKA